VSGAVDRALAALPEEGVPSWRSLVLEELARDPARRRALDEAYAAGPVNPAPENLFRAFRECPFGRTSVVLCGQDPYPDPAFAVGLAFSVPPGEKQAQSLRNILRERRDDVGGVSEAESGDLSCWARQGVLLLNTSLSVRAGEPNSHRALWGDFAPRLLALLCARRAEPLVFLLWGREAGALGRTLEAQPQAGPRLFLYAAHPSPRSARRGFFGSRPFSRANGFLRASGAREIVW